MLLRITSFLEYIEGSGINDNHCLPDSFFFWWLWVFIAMNIGPDIISFDSAAMQLLGTTMSRYGLTNVHAWQHAVPSAVLSLRLPGSAIHHHLHHMSIQMQLLFCKFDYKLALACIRDKSCQLTDHSMQGSHCLCQYLKYQPDSRRTGNN